VTLKGVATALRATVWREETRPTVERVLQMFEADPDFTLRERLAERIAKVRKRIEDDPNDPPESFAAATDAIMDDFAALLDPPKKEGT
jgi:signal transduction protein with GAF and PtsI domain